MRASVVDDEAVADAEERAWREALLDRFDQFLAYQRTQTTAALVSSFVVGALGTFAVIGLIAKALRD